MNFFNVLAMTAMIVLPAGAESLKAAPAAINLIHTPSDSQIQAALHQQQLLHAPPALNMLVLNKSSPPQIRRGLTARDRRLRRRRWRRLLRRMRRNRRRPLILIGRPISRPETFMNVIKIKEKVVVNEQNQPKHVEAEFSNDLLRMDHTTGAMRLMMHGEMHIKPKESSPIIAQATRSFLVTDGNKLTDKPEHKHTLASWLRSKHFQDFAKRWRLNEFWPLLGFSLACGFGFVSVIALISWIILSVVNSGHPDDDLDRNEYNALPTDDALLQPVTAAQPLAQNQNMKEVNEQSNLLIDIGPSGNQNN